MPKKTFTSLEKAIDILDLYDIGKQEFSAKEISEALEVPLSSVYKYIDFLVKRQLLRNKPNSKVYGLGFMIARLNCVLEKDMDLVDVARPHLKELSRDTGETSILTMIIAGDVISIDREEPDRLVKFSIDRGRRLPLHVGSTSKILLAFQDLQFIEDYLHRGPLERLTDKSITEPEKIKADLEKIREQGYAVSDSEVDSGAVAISVPVFNQKGGVIAGLTIAGPSERISKQQASNYPELLHERAGMISHDLGFRP